MAYRSIPGESLSELRPSTVSDIAGTYVLNPSGLTDYSTILNSMFGTAGTTVYLGAGTFNIKATVSMLLSNCRLIGAGNGATIIRIDDTAGNIGDGIQIKNVSNLSVQDLTISAVSTRSAGNGIRVIGGNPSDALVSPLDNAGVYIDKVDMNAQFTGIKVESDAANDYRNWRVYVRGGRHTAFAASGNGIWIDTISTASPKVGASHFVENYWFDHPSSTPNAGIRLTNSGDVTLTNCEVYGAAYALLMDPGASGFLTSVTVNGGFYDRSATSCLRIAPNASVGKFGAIVFNGTWFAGSSGNVADVVGAAAKLIKFNGCTFYSAEGSPGWCAKVDAASGVDFNGCTFSGAVTGGVLFTGSASRFQVADCRFNPTGVGTGLTTMPIGLQIDAGCDFYYAAGNDFDSAIATKITNTPGNSANRRIVSSSDNVTA